VVHAVSSSSEVAVGLNAGPFGATLGRVPLAGGAPREVLENVVWADWSPDGVDLAVVRSIDGIDRLEFPIGKVLYESKGRITHARVSPRGDRVAFVDHADPVLGFSAGSVVAVDRTGATKTLSTDWADLYGLAWRPDGREVWFTAARRDEFKALRAVTLGGEERLVARVMGQLDLEDVSRSGRVLVGHANFRIDMVGRSPGESKERELTWLGLSQLAGLSKDGARVLFTELPEGAGEGGSTYRRVSRRSSRRRCGPGPLPGRQVGLVHPHVTVPTDPPAHRGRTSEGPDPARPELHGGLVVPGQPAGPLRCPVERRATDVRAGRRWR
jgi:hypothetical protein